MASLVLNLTNSNHPKKNIQKKTYFIRYKCGECGQTHSIRVKVKRLGDEVQFVYPHKARCKVRVWAEEGVSERDTLLFGAMKMLDALGITYIPESARLRKA